MLDRRESSGSGDRVPLSDLFVGFLKVSLSGFGGGLVWARRAVVEQQQWMGEQEFAETLTFSQLMPGPNIVGIATLVLAAHPAVLSSISFGGFPTVLPDVHDFAIAKGWVTDQEFANFFAVSQVTPGPNMILMTSFVGLKVGGIPAAIAAALATFVPPCAMYYLSYRLWYRFRDLTWQRIVRRGLAPLTIGLVIAGGYVMARSAAIGWQSVAIAAAAMALMLGTRLNPLWVLTAGGALGGLGLL
jgi:chromate transporter